MLRACQDIQKWSEQFLLNIYKKKLAFKVTKIFSDKHLASQRKYSQEEPHCVFWVLSTIRQHWLGYRQSELWAVTTVVWKLNVPKLSTQFPPPEHTQINLLGRGLLSCLVLQAGVSQYIAVHNTVQLATTKTRRIN